MADDEARPGDGETPGERHRNRRSDGPGGAYAADRDDSAAGRRAERRRRGEELQRGVPKPRGRRPGYRWHDGWGDGAEYGCCLLELVWSTAAVVVAVGAAALLVRWSRRGSAGGRTGGTAARRRGSS